MSASPPMPPDGARLLSDWGMRRSRRTGEQRMHAGMDLGHSSGRGAPILNIQVGVVERVLRNEDRRRAFNGYGNGVVVHHLADDTWALYAHMDTVDVAEGQPVDAGTRLGTMGNSSNDKFAGMAPHLHLEIRRRRSNGRTPFPSPYPRSVEVPFNNLDPRPWLEGKGLHFVRRGAFEVTPGSEMDQTRGAWSASPGVAGYEPARHRVDGWMVPESAVGALGSNGDDEEENAYEPPARFDRDVRFGLTPIEWAAAGTGALVLTGATVALVVRARMRPNRRPRLRRRRTTRRR
jgi:hypothetical protein